MVSIVIGDYRYDDTGRVEVVDTTKTSYGEILDSVTIEGEVYNITNMGLCFYDCISLTQAPKIPNSVTYMGYCFHGCTSLTQAPEIPNSVTNMDECFYGCTSLTQVSEIPNSVTNMEGCFYGCTSLVQAPEIPNNITNMSNCFYHCSLVQAPEIPNSVIDMRSCFFGCTSLVHAPEIPNSVTNMSSCFDNCTSLTGFIIIHSKPTIDSYVFRNVSNSIQIYTIDENEDGIYNYWKNQSEQGVLPSKVTVAEDIPTDIEFIIGDYRYRKYDNFKLEVKTIDKTKTEYEEIKETVLIGNNNIYKICSMENCFKGCEFLIEAPNISQFVEKMDSCFDFCPSLQGNIYVNNSNITSYENIFDTTYKNDIYIINNTEPIDESVSTKWREIVAYTNNSKIHFEVDDHTPPQITLKLQRTDEGGTPKQNGTHVYIEVNYQFFEDNIPVGWESPAFNGEDLLCDSTEHLTPIQSGRYKGPYNLEDEESHIITYIVNDGYKISTAISTLPRVMALLDFLGTGGQDGYIDIPGMGMTIGNIAKRNGLDIQFPTTIGKELLPATQPYNPQEITNPSGSPSENGWYEYDSIKKKYYKTKDIEVDNSKIYFEADGENVDLDNYQLITGRYNKKNDDAVFIIGNGANDENRSNLMEVGNLITIGTSDGSRSYLQLDYHSMQMIDKEGEAYFYINDLRNSNGIASESFRADLLARDVFDIVDRNILSLRIYYCGELGLSEPVELTNILNISNYTVDGHLYKIELPSAPQSSFSLRINYRADWTQYETKTFNCDGNTRVFYIDETTRNNIYNWQALVDDEGWHCIHYKNETLTSISFYDEVSGTYEFQYTTDTPLKNYTLGIRQSTGKKGNYSVVEGYNNMASGDYSHAEGYGTIANININNPSSPKIAAHAEGYQTTAGGNASHSEGSHTTARGDDSHAEGYGTTASGIRSHAEGNNTDAYGEASHAEGGSTNAYGKYSHAGGYWTTAYSEAQTVIGKHNIDDRNNKYAFIIGNGTSSASNALTVDWQGNMSLPTGHIDTIDMTTTEISNFIAELNVSGAPINTTQDDWVVEQGMSGIWTYRKWQSGTVDCLFGSTTITGSTGALYLYRAGNIVFLSSNGAFRSSGSSIASGGTLSQVVPSGFIPKERAYIMSVSATKNWRLEFGANGSIMFYGDTAWDGNMYISGMWITNDSILV